MTNFKAAIFALAIVASAHSAFAKSLKCDHGVNIHIDAATNSWLRSFEENGQVYELKRFMYSEDKNAMTGIYYSTDPGNSDPQYFVCRGDAADLDTLGQ